jgi:hypothetical protein
MFCSLMEDSEIRWIPYGLPWWRGEGDSGLFGSPAGDPALRAQGVLSPRTVTSPARGPVLTAILGVAELSSCYAATPLFMSMDGIHICAFLLRLPPPARGRCGEFDGGPFCFLGV